MKKLKSENLNLSSKRSEIKIDLYDTKLKSENLEFFKTVNLSVFDSNSLGYLPILGKASAIYRIIVSINWKLNISPAAIS